MIRGFIERSDLGKLVLKQPEVDTEPFMISCYEVVPKRASVEAPAYLVDLIVEKMHARDENAMMIENKVYLAVANRYGKESAGGEDVEFNGISGVWKYNGELMAQAGPADETVLTVEIEPEKTRNKSFNPYNDIFGDRRPEYYIIK